jgi:signal recognition particle subunit SEC65
VILLITKTHKINVDKIKEAIFEVLEKLFEKNSLISYMDITKNVYNINKNNFNNIYSYNFLKRKIREVLKNLQEEQKINILYFKKYKKSNQRYPKDWVDISGEYIIQYNNIKALKQIADKIKENMMEGNNRRITLTILRHSGLSEEDILQIIKIKCGDNVYIEKEYNRRGEVLRFYNKK